MKNKNYCGFMHTTDDWTIGIHYPCKECDGIIMEDTDLEIPYDSTRDLEFDDIILGLNIEYTTKAHWLYDDWDFMCHCDEEDY